MKYTFRSITEKRNYNSRVDVSPKLMKNKFWALCPENNYFSGARSKGFATLRLHPSCIPELSLPRSLFLSTSWTINVILLNIAIAFQIWKDLVKIRISNHKLMIEIGRYNQTSRNDRFCPICNSNIIEDEFHFLFHCPKYSIPREKF